MKRDLDLVRRILLDLEQDHSISGSHSGWSRLIEEGYAPEAIHYHVQLLNDAGLIQADELVPGQWWPERITWAGHEFIDSARNEKIWSRARQRIERSLGGASFEVLSELLAGMARESLAPSSRRKRRK